MYSDVNVPPLAASFLYSSLWCFELSGLQGVSLVQEDKGSSYPVGTCRKRSVAAGYRWTLDLGLWKLVRIPSTKSVSTVFRLPIVAGMETRRSTKNSSKSCKMPMKGFADMW